MFWYRFTSTFFWTSAALILKFDKNNMTSQYRHLEVRWILNITDNLPTMLLNNNNNNSEKYSKCQV